MKNFEIRSASLNDIEVLLQFEQGVIEAERPFDPSLAKDPITYYDLEDMISSEDAEVVVVVNDNEIIASGYAKIKEARHYLNHETYAYLGFMYTKPEFRGRGINRQVINTLKEWSNARGLKEIRLTVYEENIGAIKAYEKVGFKKHMIEMRIE